MTLKKLITTGLIVGFTHGLMSLYGLVHGFEYLIWGSLGIIFTWWIVAKGGDAFLKLGLLSGLSIAIGTGLLQGLFLETYLSHNPEYAQSLDPETDYRLFTFGFMFIFGSIYGLMIGVLAVAINKLTKLNSHATHDQARS